MFSDLYLFTLHFSISVSKVVNKNNVLLLCELQEQKQLPSAQPGQPSQTTTMASIATERRKSSISAFDWEYMLESLLLDGKGEVNGGKWKEGWWYFSSCSVSLSLLHAFIPQSKPNTIPNLRQSHAIYVNCDNMNISFCKQFLYFWQCNIYIWKVFFLLNKYSSCT